MPGGTASARSWLAVPLTVLGVLATLPVQAQRPVAVPQFVPVSAGVPFSDLPPEQVRALAPLAGVWSSLDGEQQRKWIELGARSSSMSAGEQRLLHERMREWAAMSPQDRQRARVQFQQASQLSPQERLERWQAYQSLPPEQRLRIVPAPDGAAGRTAPLPPKSTAKSTLVAPPAAPAVRPGPRAAVQAVPGATTRPLTRTDDPPLHQQTGLPKLVATPDFVDRSTLLPKRGAQAAPVREPTAPAPPAPHADR